ncbi:MAG TPA: HDOD domain-containing protein [Terriglobales bacterium]|nr:HDOD domain-containing protein [Terriglobales bacterium]
MRRKVRADKESVGTGAAISRAKAAPSAAVPWRPEQLPPFPAIALKALNLIAGRDTSLLELCDLIRPDPAFSTAILKIANSPLVAFSRNITSVVQASMLLGFQRLKSIVITVGLKAYLQGPVAPALEACWRHSVACAAIAERAAGRGLDRDFAYTAGIMHDIGRAAMAAAAPATYMRVVETEADDPRDLLPREREQFGLDHCETGASLVKLWNLPGAFLEITARHHAYPSRPADTESIVASSCLLADTLGFGMTKYRAAPSYADVLATFGEAARNELPENAETLAAEIATEIQVIEAV